MAARSEDFPWPGHYGHFKFFETRMNQHGKVAALNSEGNGVYRLTRKNGGDLRIFICECYVFGVAEYAKTIGELGEVDAIIINSNWCGYSPEAKRECRDQKVGLFTIKEFMTALHQDDFWTYLTDKEKELFAKRGWL